MTTRLAYSLFALAVPFGLYSVPATAAESSPKPTCPADSPGMTVAEIVALGSKAVGRCVSTDGWARGDTLQADNLARYRLQRIYNDPSSTGAILGLYGRDYSLPQVAARVVGRIGDCDALHEQVKTLGPGKVVGGFCSFSKGFYIEANEIKETGPADPVRLTARTAPGLGNLAPMADGPAREKLAAAFAPLLIAFRAGDRDALQRFLPYRSASGYNVAYIGEPPRWDRHVAILTEDERIPLLDDPKVEILGWRTPLWADAETVAGNRADMQRTTRGIACAATQASAAAGLWPILEADAAVAPRRPYICVEISIDAKGVAQYSISHDGRPAREPA